MSMYDDYMAFRESMGAKFKRFTVDARRSIIHCQELARRQNWPVMEVEHVLLGALKTVIDPAFFDQQQGSGAPRGDIAFTPEATRAMEQALRLCLIDEDDEIEAQHLIRGALKVIGKRTQPEEATG